MDCQQCDGEMTSDYIPFCTYCLHDGIDDELRHLLPTNDETGADDGDERERKQKTEQSGLGGFA